MSFRQVFFASGAAIFLIAPVAEVSAQYRYYDRPTLERQKPQQRPAQSVRPQQVEVRSNTKPVTPANKKPVEQQAQPAVPANQKPVERQAKPVTPENQKPIEQQARPVPVAPLTEEQLAAKATVDELLARDPALIAAKQIPDPALARAAAAKHNAEEAKVAALKARQEAEAVKRREIEEKNKARDEAKTAALKAKPDAQAKNTKPKIEPTKNKPAPTAVSAPQAPSAPVKPVMRMPAPDGLPMARNL